MYYNTNDYRDYLAHHGILGMRWGKRNGPPYPLGVGDHSASEKKAGWQDSLDKKQRDRAKRIKKDYTERDDYTYSKTTRHVKEDLKQLLKDEEIVSAKKKYEEANKESIDFENNKELRERYATYAGLINAKAYSDTEPKEKAVRVWLHKYDDLDQGTGNSFSLYLLDKGTSMSEYGEKVYNAEKAYNEAIEKAVDKYLGNYGDTVLRTYPSGYKQTAKHVTKQAMRTLDDAKGWYDGHMNREDEDWYRKELKEAKKEYKDYADIDFNVDYDDWAKRHGFN